jgi:hypothetical protein
MYYIAIKQGFGLYIIFFYNEISDNILLFFEGDNILLGYKQVFQINYGGK